MRNDWNYDASDGAKTGEGGTEKPSGAALGARTRTHQGANAAPQVAAPVAGFFQSLLSALVALWVLAAVVSFSVDVEPLYTFLALGLLFSVQATYYKRQLSVNPGYRIPGCKCGRVATDRTETVLGSEASSVFSIPASVIGTVAYAALFLLVLEGRHEMASVLAGSALLASAYLAYVMVARIRALCSVCIGTCAVNVLIVWNLTT